MSCRHIFNRFPCIFLALTASCLPSRAEVPPPLTARDTGLYAGQAWPETKTEIAPGSALDRTKDLTFSIRNIWVRTDEDARTFDPAGIIREIEYGWTMTPKRTQLIRIDFWGNGGKERYEGALAETGVYIARMEAVLQKIEPVLDKIQGVSISEENVPDGGRSAVLKSIYEHVKAKYPKLTLYQWWSPNIAIPDWYEDIYLPADGWIIDPYSLCVEMYPDARYNLSDDPYRRVIQKYLVTGKPLVTVISATQEVGYAYNPDDPRNEYGIDWWKLRDHQFQTNVNYNLPTAFYWTRPSGTIYFPAKTGDAWMDRINRQVAGIVRRAQSLPGNYEGDPRVIEVWKNDDATKLVRENFGRIYFHDDFRSSKFLDESSGAGFRDLIWKPGDLAVRGYKIRKPNAVLTYHFKSDEPMFAPVARANAQVDWNRHGAVKVSLSRDGANWPVSGQTLKGSGGYQVSAETAGRADFAGLRELWVKIEMTGDGGSAEPVARITDLIVSAHPADQANKAEVNAAVVKTYLDVDFERGYNAGKLEGQSGGTAGGKWVAGPGHYEIVPDAGVGGGNALRASRLNGSEADLTMADPVDTSRGKLYYAVDIYRNDDGDAGTWTLRNPLSGNNGGVGFTVPAGPSPVLQAVLAGAHAAMPSSYRVVNGKWQRIEIEADCASHTYNMYVQVQGRPGRILVAEDVAWDPVHALLQEFQIYPLGGAESRMLSDNLIVWQVASFPVKRPGLDEAPAQGVNE